MTERVPIYNHLVSGTPGVDAIYQPREAGTADTIRNAIPSNNLQPFGIVASQQANTPVSVALGISTIAGRLGAGPVQGLTAANVLAVLRAVSVSAGAGDQGKPVLLGEDGKLSATMLPPVASGGETNVGTNLGSGGGAVFAQKNGVALEFRRLQTGTPNSLTVSQTTNDVVVRTNFQDSVTATTALWSSSKIAAELGARLSALVQDDTPELGGDLDLGGFALVQGGEEILRWDAVEEVLYILGKPAILPDLVGLQDGDGIFYDATNERWVNGPVTGAPGGSGTASGTSFTATGNISATNVQAAIAELDSEKSPTTHTHGILAANDLNGAGLALGDVLAYHPTAVGGAPGFERRALIPTQLSPSAFEVGRVLIGDGNGKYVDALLNANLLQDVIVASPAKGHELLWDPTANGGDGAFRSVPGLGNAVFHVDKLVSQAINNGALAPTIQAGWNVVNWDEANVRKNTGEFTLEGGTGTSDRWAVKVSRAGTYRAEIRITQHTVDNATTNAVTGIGGRSFVYKGDAAGSFGSIVWTAVPGSTVYCSTGPVRLSPGASSNGPQTYQTLTYSFPVTLAAGERLRLDYQRQALGDAQLELAAGATSFALYGPFEN